MTAVKFNQINSANPNCLIQLENMVQNGPDNGDRSIALSWGGTPYFELKHSGNSTDSISLDALAKTVIKVANQHLQSNDLLTEQRIAVRHLASSILYMYNKSDEELENASLFTRIVHFISHFCLGSNQNALQRELIKSREACLNYSIDHFIRSFGGDEKSIQQGKHSAAQRMLTNPVLATDDALYILQQMKELNMQRKMLLCGMMQRDRDVEKEWIRSLSPEHRTMFLHEIWVAAGKPQEYNFGEHYLQNNPDGVLIDQAIEAVMKRVLS